MPCDAVTQQSVRIQADARVALVSRESAQTFGALMKMKLGMESDVNVFSYSRSFADVYIGGLNLEVSPEGVKIIADEDDDVSNISAKVAEVLMVMAQFQAMQIIAATAKAVTRNEALPGGMRLMEIEI